MTDKEIAAKIREVLNDLNALLDDAARSGLIISVQVEDQRCIGDIAPQVAVNLARKI